MSETEKETAVSGRTQVLRAAGLVGALVLLARVVGLLREVVVRALLGIDTPAATAFEIANRFPEAIFLILAGGAIGAAFIPTFTAYFERDDAPGGWRLFSAIINLVLVVMTAVGLNNRIAEIEALQTNYGKVAHAEALQSAARLQQQLQQNLAHHPIATHLFPANALRPDELQQKLTGQSIDLVIADVPYGRRANWQGVTTDTTDPLWRLLDSLLGVLSPHTLMAIAANKSQMCNHDQYTRWGKFQVGKRCVFLLQPGHGKV
ncbi:MAG: hypothetical protein HS099_03530 [Ardenticatenaceae bacterium]|nr:hypothetical protein [Ardenticatenaceae bacterium]